MAFQVYHPRAVGRSSVTISVSPSGRIGLSTLCFNTYFKGARNVELYYDRSANKIGLKPCQEPSKHSMRLTAIGKGPSYLINGRGFLKANRVQFEGLRRFIPDFDEESGMLVISLD
ncbi:MAG: hypothetical protein GXO90_00145 [FCB group bacterium]|nr:hypothetical protein [FCB group bacterium]